jgi:hypothetical protein
LKNGGELISGCSLKTRDKKRADHWSVSGQGFSLIIKLADDHHTHDYRYG